MSITLAEVARQLDVQPGRPAREPVGDRTLELRFVDDDEISPEFANQGMLFAPSIPFRSEGRVVNAKLVPTRLPDPIVIDDWDLTPE